MVFNLYAIEGYKHQEIASMLGINEGTSKSQLSHARKMLQGQINKLKITVMEPNKLEKQFKEQLNSREIQPSEMA
jgi:transposase